jgi:hypothetical protein
VTHVTNGWALFRQHARVDGVPRSSLEDLEEAIDELEGSIAEGDAGTKLARVANAVSKPMERVFGTYQTVVPPRVLTLDYLGNELLIDAKRIAR